MDEFDFMIYTKIIPHFALQNFTMTFGRNVLISVHPCNMFFGSVVKTRERV
jgi:hypothetical protein